MFLAVMQMSYYIPKSIVLVSSMLVGCMFLFAVPKAGGSMATGERATTEQGGCPLGASETSAGAHRRASTQRGQVVPARPVRLQLCRYFRKDDMLRLAPTSGYPSAAVARAFARRFNRLPQPQRPRRCGNVPGYITAFFGYQRRVVPVTVSLGGCRLVTGASRNALADSELLKHLVGLTSGRDIPFDTRLSSLE